MGGPQGKSGAAATQGVVVTRGGAAGPPAVETGTTGAGARATTIGIATAVTVVATVPETSAPMFPAGNMRTRSETPTPPLLYRSAGKASAMEKTCYCTGK